MFATLETHGVDYGTSSWEKVRQAENIVDGAIDDIINMGFELQYIIDRVNVRAREKGVSLTEPVAQRNEEASKEPGDFRNGPWSLAGLSTSPGDRSPS